MNLRCFFRGHWWKPETRLEEEYWPDGIPGQPENFPFTTIQRRRECARCGNIDTITHREYPQGDGTVQVGAVT